MRDGSIRNGISTDILLVQDAVDASVVTEAMNASECELGEANEVERVGEVNRPFVVCSKRSVEILLT